MNIIAVPEGFNIALYMQDLFVSAAPFLLIALAFGIFKIYKKVLGKLL